MRRDYTAMEIAAMTKEQVFALPEGGLRITFCNGERVICKTTAVAESRFYWQLFIEYNVTGILPKHFVGNQYSTSVHLKIAGETFWTVFMNTIGQLQPGQGLDVFWELSRRIYQVGNEIYNHSVVHDAEHMSSLDIMDLIEILEHPTVASAKEMYARDEITVDEAHNIIYAFMESDDVSLIENEVARCVRCGIYSRRQIVQMIGPRAIIPDINGEAFKTPIEPGYVEGLNTYYDRAIESRTASIAYANAKGPLEDSQYNNRQCQLMGGVIRTIHPGDCGSKHPIPWQIKDKDALSRVTGKFHIDENGVPILLKGDEEHLIGTTLKIRSITTCQHHDSTSPCSICLGLSAWTTPPDTVPGHHLMIAPLAQISQTILSTKHVISSTKCLFIDIDSSNSKWLAHNPENFQEVILKKAVSKNERIAIRVPVHEAMFINDVISASSPELLVPSRITEISNLQVMVYGEDNAVKMNYDLDVSVASLGCPLSYEFLVHARNNSWELIGDYLEFDMTDWDHSFPLVISPRRGDDIMSILRDVEGFLHSFNKPGVIRAVDQRTPGDAIDALLTLMLKKIDVNFVNVEVFVRALMSRIDEMGRPTYELPVGGEPFMFITMKDAILNRSVGAALGFERQDSFLLNPASFNRQDMAVAGSELDALYGEYGGDDTINAVLDSPCEVPAG